MLDFGTIVKDTIKKVGKKITNSIKNYLLDLINEMKIYF